MIEKRKTKTFGGGRIGKWIRNCFREIVFRENDRSNIIYYIYNWEYNIFKYNTIPRKIILSLTDNNIMEKYSDENDISYFTDIVHDLHL